MKFNEVSVVKLFIYMYSLIKVSIKWNLTRRKMKRYITINSHDLNTVKNSRPFISSLVMTYVKYIRYTVTVGKTVQSLLQLLPFNIGSVINKLGSALTKDYVATMQNAEPACAYHMTEYIYYHIGMYKEDTPIFIRIVMICTQFFPSEDMKNIYNDILQYTNIKKSKKDEEFINKLSKLFSKSLESKPENESCPKRFQNISVFKRSRGIFSSQMSSFKKENTCVNLNEMIIKENDENQILEYVEDIAKSGVPYHVYKTKKYTYRIPSSEIQNIQKFKKSTDYDSISIKPLIDYVDTSDYGNRLKNDELYADTIKNSNYPWWYSIENKSQYVYFSSPIRSTIKNVHKIRLQSEGLEHQAIQLSKSKSKNTVRLFTDVQFSTLMFENGFPAGLIEIENPSVLDSQIDTTLTYYILNIPYSMPYIFIMFIVMWRAEGTFPIESELQAELTQEGLNNFNEQFNT